jgi:hypothetical protein
VEDERLWTEIRTVRNELLTEVRELRTMLTVISERLRTVEVARENSALRNNALPGWLIAVAGVLVSIGGVVVTLVLAGRLP